MPFPWQLKPRKQNDRNQGVRVSHTFSAVITGAGGAGAITTGQLLLEAAGRQGWYGLMRRSVGPQIRGGESAALLRLSDRPVSCLADNFQLLVALDWKNAERFASEIPLTADSEIVADPAVGEVPTAYRQSGARITEVAWKSLSREIKGGRANMIALGYLAARIGIDLDEVAAIASRGLAAKGEAVVAAAVESLTVGHSSVDTGSPLNCGSWERKPKSKHWLLSGNTACGLGALRAGVRFVAAYPITPATELLEWLAPRIERLGGTLVQAEDELASINMVIGASYGGVPALTATSGPGLALMTEALGLAVTSETPAVVINVMRGGPSTGIPTKSEQSDLNIALHGLHGDAPHLVLAPTSIADCAHTTHWAVNLAQRLQTAAIVLSDQAMGQAQAIVDPVPVDNADTIARPAPDAARAYLRYALSEDGLSPMAIPGAPGLQYTAEGLEHNEHGTPSSQAEDHQQQLDKRLRKLTSHDYGEAWALCEGDGPLAVITWGSITGAVAEGLASGRRAGVAGRLIAIRLLAPVQRRRLMRALAGVDRALVVEQTHSGQFLHYLKALGILPAAVSSLCHPGPLAISPGQVEAALLALHSEPTPTSPTLEC